MTSSETHLCIKYTNFTILTYNEAEWILITIFHLYKWIITTNQIELNNKKLQKQTKKSKQTFKNYTSRSEFPLLWRNKPHCKKIYIWEKKKINK